MAHLRFADKVRAQLADAVSKGAKKLIDTEKYFPADKVIQGGGGVYKEAISHLSLQVGTTFVGPQILVNVTHDMPIMQEEVISGSTLQCRKVV